MSDEMKHQFSPKAAAEIAAYSSAIASGLTEAQAREVICPGDNGEEYLVEKYCGEISESEECDTIEVDERLKIQFVTAFRQLQSNAANNVKAKGFDLTNAPEQIALMHSELSEALEALRLGNPPDKHLPHRDHHTVELADEIIRNISYSGANAYDVGLAVIEKINFNITRSKKHGKEF